MPNNQNNVCQDTGQRIKKKSTVKHPKPSLMCVVCNGTAHGYNFDAISCESCKAFFRRNARQPPGKLKCRNSNHCNVAFDQRKRCKKCRMEKCFSAGMRKEWILTDQEKQEKRLKIEENRRLKQKHDYNEEDQQFTKIDFDIDGTLIKYVKTSPSAMITEVHLTENDRLKIKFLENAFIDAVRLNQTSGIPHYPSIQPIGSTLDLFRVPIFISSMRLITYFKQIPEFQQLHTDDQVYLVKLNTLSIVFLHSIFIYDSQNAFYHEQNTMDPLFLESDWINTITKEFHLKMKQIQTDLIEITQTHPKIIKLLFLIILFSSHFSFKYSTISYNTSDIFNAQNIYSELLYRYCLHHYSLYQSSELFLRFTNNIMRLQTLISDLKSTISDYVDTTKLSPLMQSLL